MSKIKNTEELLARGDVQSRKIVLQITEKTLQRLDSYERIKQIMSLNGDILQIGNKKWDLSNKRNVYLVGAGKAGNAMAMAVDHILGDRLTKGMVIVKIKENSDRLSRTTLYEGGHPLPNMNGVNACREILELVDQAGSDDLFIAVMSGGSTALMCFPAEGITLNEKIEATDIMLKSGAGVAEINAVRRHISRMNGGRLGQRIESRGAELICFSIYDAVGMPETGDIGEPVQFWGTPVGPDETTLEEAKRVIKDYALEGRLPKSIIDYLNSCGPECETPKALPGNTYYIINTVPDSCRYAAEIAAEMGLPYMILTSFIEGESRDAGTFFGAIAREIQSFGRPIAPPCLVICSGETTTKILDNSKVKGHGGPSQEMTLSFALTAAKTSGACLLSIDSEGTDGTTIAAGGITDSTTLKAAEETGIDVHRALREHATHEALTEVGDCVVTGNTGTNLCDFNIMYVPEKG